MKRLAFLLLVTVLLVAGCSLHANGNVSDTDELDRMIGQMVMVGFRGLDAGPGSPVADDIRAGVGGVILFSKDCVLSSPVRNIADPAQLKALTASLQGYAEIPLFIAVDQEGGRISRLSPENGFPATMSAAEIGNSGDPGAAFRSGKLIGRTMKEEGLNLDFAPVVDVNRNPGNPVIAGLQRSFSNDPETVAVLAEAFIKGLHSEGVLSCIKHFPGHGSSEGDSHKGFTDVTGTWSREELLPFEKLIRDGRTDMVMTAHIFNAELDPDNPATLSHRVISDLLRGDMGFDSIVITDDMGMGAISNIYGFKEAVLKAVNAGADIILLGNNLTYEPNPGIRAVDTIRELVHEGRISERRIRRSYERIMRVKKRMQLSD
ncbi:glycoside hydrolase family 3 protein [Maridesulfovibrio sp.]|uniref:glycoside hydrolase family 3 protein n=1 Tax=Maridesulfovibrio sp. TaxID=2795000 RepID=UPI002A188906|nr:glycoside hydrolase family 3 protein [Maridesulfovibrio sp.]